MRLAEAVHCQRTRRFLLLLGVSVPSFMTNLDASIVAESLSSVTRSIHADFAGMEFFGDGFQAMLLVAATFAAPPALLTWALVRQRDTVAIERKSHPLR
jgi:hypothetical protein